MAVKLVFVDFMLRLRQSLPHSCCHFTENVRCHRLLALNLEILTLYNDLRFLFADFVFHRGRFTSFIKLLLFPSTQSLVDGHGPVPILDGWVLHHLHRATKEYDVHAAILLAALVNDPTRL